MYFDCQTDFGRRFSNRGPAPQSRRLYVEGLTRYVDTDWLHKVFSECGEIDNIETAPIRGHARSRGYAYVEYKDQEAADKAWVTLHGEELDGRKIFVLSHCSLNNRLRSISRSPDSHRRLFRRSPSRNRSPHPWRRSLRPWRRPGYRSRSPLGRKSSPGWDRSPSSSERSRRTSSSSTITSSVGRYRSAERSDDRSRSPSTTTWSSSESNYSDYSSRSSRQRYRSLSRENYLAGRPPIRERGRNPYRLPRRWLPWRLSAETPSSSSGSTTSGYDSSLGSD